MMLTLHTAKWSGTSPTNIHKYHSIVRKLGMKQSCPDSRNKTPTSFPVGVGYLRLILYLFKSCNVLSNSDTFSRPL